MLSRRSFIHSHHAPRAFRQSIGYTPTLRLKGQRDFTPIVYVTMLRVSPYLSGLSMLIYSLSSLERLVTTSIALMRCNLLYSPHVLRQLELTLPAISKVRRHLWRSRHYAMLIGGNTPRTTHPHQAKLSTLAQEVANVWHVYIDTMRHIQERVSSE